MKKIFTLTLVLGLFCFSMWTAAAQDQPAQQQPSPSTEELEKQKAERAQNAYRLLDQVIDEAQQLRLTENRVRVQINAADMLWDQNQGRARSLFATAAEGVAELGRTPNNNTPRRFSDTTGVNTANLRTYQLRQDLVLAAARHDAPLAYQMLAATKTATQVTNDVRGYRVTFTAEDNLEQTLLGRIAALDPKLAAQNADQMMEKGQFPVTLPEVISQLRRQDADAADKLADKAVKRLQATNLLSTTDAIGLLQQFLRPGPRPAGESANAAAKQQTPSQAVLNQSAYVDLLSTTIDAALKATPGSQNNQRGPIQGRAGIGPGGARPGTPSQPTDAQIEQNNARRLLAGLQPVLPMIDQYLPMKAQPLRQKMTDMGMQPNMPAAAFAFQGAEATTDLLMQAAAMAPQQMQTRLYQQAAYKAIDEGDTERARQIATDHLQSNARDAVMKRIDFREMAKKAEGARLEDVRQAVARLQTDTEKIDLLLQVSGDIKQANPKLATQLLDDARQITNRRATAYENFEQQLKVAHAYASIDPGRSFEVLDPGISQLNELLSAASVLSGFEINMFRDGEMTMQGGNGLTAMVNRYGQELAVLARSDFDRSETLAGRFQFPEARIMTRMAMVQGLLDIKSISPRGNFGPPDSVIIRQD